MRKQRRTRTLHDAVQLIRRDCIRIHEFPRAIQSKERDNTEDNQPGKAEVDAKKQHTRDREESGRNLVDAISVRGTCPNVCLRGQ